MVCTVNCLTEFERSLEEQFAIFRRVCGPSVESGKSTRSVRTARITNPIEWTDRPSKRSLNDCIRSTAQWRPESVCLFVVSVSLFKGSAVQRGSSLFTIGCKSIAASVSSVSPNNANSNASVQLQNNKRENLRNEFVAGVSVRIAGELTCRSASELNRGEAELLYL